KLGSARAHGRMRIGESRGAILDCTRGTHGAKDGRGTLRCPRGPRNWPERIESERARRQSAIWRKPRRAGGAPERSERSGRGGGICPNEAHHASDFWARRGARLAEVLLPFGSAPISAGIAGRRRAHRDARKRRLKK